MREKKVVDEKKNSIEKIFIPTRQLLPIKYPELAYIFRQNPISVGKEVITKAITGIKTEINNDIFTCFL